MNELRDPQEASPLSHPTNVYPLDVVEGVVEGWEDGMQTFIYSWNGRNGSGKQQEGMGGIAASLTHVFTGNTEWLQRDAVDLLREFQLRVPLQRKMGSASQYDLISAFAPLKSSA